MSHRVRLIHWDAAEAAGCAALLVGAGYGVDARSFDEAGTKAMRLDPPVALVVDMSKLPSHGLAVATAVRGVKALGALPIVFAGGSDTAHARAARAVPGAHCTPWSRIRSTLRRAIANAPATPAPARPRRRASSSPR